MCISISAGDTFIIDKPGTNLDSHLWIVISDPARSHFVLVVNLTSYREDKDGACILGVGDHPFIRHKTCVNFPMAKLFAIRELKTILKNPNVSTRERLAEEVLQRIRDRVPESRITLGHYSFLLDQGLVSE